MSESRPTPAEQHLGDRLSALVDGELGHEARERVLAHLATCGRCRVEAEAQRRLKHVFAEVSAPTPSESFLARLQGLPAGGPDEPRGTVRGTGDEEHGSSVFGSRRTDPFGLAASATHGFPIHDVGRAQAERAVAASRSRRFAFVAASAVSLAAVALGGVTTVVPVADAERGGLRSNVTPARQQGVGTTAATDTRRRTAAPLLAQNTSAQRRSAPAGAPLLSGGAQSVRGDGGLAPTPLIGPGAPVAPVLPGLLAAPEPTGTVAPPPVGR
ncbi:zf-HC2 domain-containing protein [Streptomyces chilikensis]|uniref:zf-HC2 domain-containing protein n=1 Tax=Streptomyces chilikensis TaxID=1194079 RepID=UPI00140BD700|nr:zf-HC2 domain-containing protein [Streptomyces chilikensis]